MPEIRVTQARRLARNVSLILAVGALATTVVGCVPPAPPPPPQPVMQAAPPPPPPLPRPVRPGAPVRAGGELG